MDAIIFGCNCTLFMVFISGKDNVSSLEDSSSLTSAFISFFSILLLVMYNFLSGVKAIDADRNTVAFSVSSMGAADFVYNEDLSVSARPKGFSDSGISEMYPTITTKNEFQIDDADEYIKDSLKKYPLPEFENLKIYNYD